MVRFWTEPLDPERDRNPMEAARYFTRSYAERRNETKSALWDLKSAF
jgi:hypothetical protein